MKVEVVINNFIYGVGLNDVGYVAGCPQYSRWTSMLSRCYSKSTQARNPWYVGCLVCEEWLKFSKFKLWTESKTWVDRHLDKDLLGDGKLYGPDTCCFLTKQQNDFLIVAATRTGEYPIGVSKHSSSKLLRARVNNPLEGRTEHLGYFECPMEAHAVWKERKLEIGMQLFKGEPKHVMEAVIKRYS